ncbi:MAG: tRNA threonylcarbamoyladenosine dehydratase [Microscillaceae bacterium]|jgi:tRNA A37 threonylcarbamoyladenosine dehydratase|nr:tRNA threonylcarbamoyladenosine dehydratase [Microscillaceae bacterium]
MQTHWNIRTELLIGEPKLQKLAQAHILLVGLGGVGACCAEMLARAGIGKITIVDTDVVEQSNRNRQLGALTLTEGSPKVSVWAKRLLEINPQIDITAHQIYLQAPEITQLLQTSYDYVIDAIDTLTPKIELIAQTLQKKLPLVSAMGAGGKLDPLQVQISDISQSYNCRLARYVRKRLKALGYRTGFKVVFSPEDIDKHRVKLAEGIKHKKSVIGTISYMPNIFGCMVASVVIRDLIADGDF